MHEAQDLQSRYALGNRCYGCGLSNPEGLRIKSVPLGKERDTKVPLGRYG